MAAHYRIEIHLLEDLHTGSGTGSGDVDAALQRDRRGFPVIPWSHFKGVLRDRARLLAELGVMDARHVAELFGEAAGRRQQSRTGDSGRGRLLGTSAYTEIERTLVWSGTRLDPDSRTAMKDHLRTLEAIPSGARFVLDAVLHGPAEAALTGSFESLLQSVDALGGDRSRGLGRVGIAFTRRRVAHGAAGRVLPKELARPRLRLLLRALDPLCLAVTGQPGNLIPTESFIRGQTLLGALAGWALREGMPAAADLLLERTLEIGDGIPLPEAPLPHDLAAAEAQPIPLSVETPKPAGNAADVVWPWWAGAPGPLGYLGARGERDALAPDGTASGSNDKPKRPGPHEYLYRAGPEEPWRRYEPEMGVRMRVAVPEQAGKDPDLFSTEEIAENTRFLAEIRFHDRESAERFHRRFFPVLAGTAWLTLGRGGRPALVENHAWLGPAEFRPAEHGFRLTLLSDCVIRDHWLRFHTRLDALSLRDGLGQHGPAKQVFKDLKIESRYCEATDLRGFNALTGLPRPARRAIRRGSSILVAGPGSGELATALDARGHLGEGAHEGLGRFLLEPLQPHPEILMAVARRLALKAAQTNDGPSRSQWGYFHGRALAAATMQDLQALFTDTDSAKQKAGGRAWTHARLDEMKHVALGLPLEQARDFLDAFVRWLFVFHKERAQP